VEGQPLRQVTVMDPSEHASEPHRIDSGIHDGICRVGAKPIAHVHRLAVDANDVHRTLPATARGPLACVRDISRLPAGDDVEHSSSLRTHRDWDKSICSAFPLLAKLPFAFKAVTSLSVRMRPRSRSLRSVTSLRALSPDCQLVRSPFSQRGIRQRFTFRETVLNR
jgi:hypothetical protein